MPRGLFFLPLMVLASGSAIHARSDESVCRVELIDSRTAAAADGTTISSDAGEIVSGRNEHLVLGTQTMSWPGKLSKSRRPIELLGFVRDAKGMVRGVPMPSPQARYARGAYDGSGGWHVIYAEPMGGRLELEMQNADSASLVYAHFDGVRWTTIQNFAVVSNASLHPAFASGLIRSGNTLYFAFPFERRRGSAPRQAGGRGLVMVTLQNRSPRAAIISLDTLSTWASPIAVRIVRAKLAGVTVLIAQDHFRNRRPWPTGLFITEYARKWAEPQLFWSDSLADASAPILTGSVNGLVVSWKSTIPGSNKSSLLTASTRVGNDRTPTQTLTDIDPFAGLAEVSMNSSRNVWLWRDFGSANSLSAIVRNDNQIDRPLRTAIRIQNFAPVATKLSDSTAIVITGVLHDPISESPAAIISILRTRCN